MAMDIFSGANFKVFLGAAGSTLATDFEEVPEIAAFINTGFESTVIEVVSFNSKFNRKLLGSKKINDMDLKVNLLPGNSTHVKLEQLAKDQKRCQIKLEFYTDETCTEGFYEVYQCFLSSAANESDQDQPFIKNYKVTADSIIDSGLLQ